MGNNQKLSEQNRNDQVTYTNIILANELQRTAYDLHRFHGEVLHRLVNLQGGWMLAVDMVSPKPQAAGAPHTSANWMSNATRSSNYNSVYQFLPRMRHAF